MSVLGRLKHAYNAFTNLDQAPAMPGEFGSSYNVRPDRTRFLVNNERSIISSIYTRLAIDVSAIPIKHVRLDDSDRYLEDVASGLNSCLTLEANLDQAARAFRQDVVMTLFDRGVAAIVAVDTTVRPDNPGSYDVLSMRVGHVVQWFPSKVRVSVYNEQTGRREEVTLDKKHVGIIENPLYSVMNEPNSTLKRLTRKLSLLDTVDETASSGKLDLIVQLPYVIKSEARRQQAESRRKDIEFQLTGSKYGVAYTDGTEKITQLNRPIENNLLAQIEVLKTQLYSELGITKEVMEGTAPEAVMVNYHNRAVEPVLAAIVEELCRTFLTKTARTQGQSIKFFLDPFRLLALSDIAEIADKFTRNEILSSNELRQVIGIKPSKDPKADQLRNSNMPQSELGQITPAVDPSIDPSISSAVAPPIRVPSSRAIPTPAIR